MLTANSAAEAKRAKFLEYFADPTPAHRMPHNTERVARLFADGLSELEIVNKLGISRENITKMLKAAWEIVLRPKVVPSIHNDPADKKIPLPPMDLGAVDSFLERERVEDAAWQNYLASKQETVEELQASPGYVLGDPGAIGKVQEEIFFRTLEDAKRVATDKVLAYELFSGRKTGFNKAYSTFAPNDDAMARAFQADGAGEDAYSGEEVEYVAEGPDAAIEKAYHDSPNPDGGGHDGLIQNEVEKNLNGFEETQRVKLLAFLNSTASRGMRDTMRKVARLFAEGSSRNEIARNLDMELSQVSRLVKAALEMANKPR